MKPFNSAKFFPFIFGLVVLMCTSQKCTKESDTPVDDPHAKITIRLGGDYASGESGTATVNGVVIGTVSETQTASAVLESGKTFNASVETINVPSTLVTSGTKTEGTPISWTAECNGATLRITPDPVYTGLGDVLYMNGIGKPIGDPNVPTVFNDFKPGKNLLFEFRDQTGKIRHSVTQTIGYKLTWTYQVPYK